MNMNVNEKDTEVSGQSDSTAAPQQDPTWPTAGQALPDAGQSLPKDGLGSSKAGLARQKAAADLQKSQYDAFDLARMSEIAEDLQERLSNNNKFEQLTPEQRDAIFALLENYPSRTVATVLAEPPPRGMNFQISKSALNNFRARELAGRKNQHAQAAADLLDKSDHPEKVFRHTVERMLKMRLLTVSSDPDLELKTIESLVTTLTKFQKQSITEKLLNS